MGTTSANLIQLALYTLNASKHEPALHLPFEQVLKKQREESAKLLGINKSTLNHYPVSKQVFFFLPRLKISLALLA